MESTQRSNEARAKRGRGRPCGRSEKGAQTERHLYETALSMFASEGFEETTLRAIAREAGVSPGLLYRYFPSKRSLVLQLYSELSTAYACKVEEMSSGAWRDRFLFALETSIAVLTPHRSTLTALIPVLVSRGEEGIFSGSTSFARERVENAFVFAVENASDKPKNPRDLGWVLYLGHLAVLMWWLLDQTPEQVGTEKLIALVRKRRRWFSMALSLPFASSFLATFTRISRASLLGEALPKEAKV